MRDVQLEVFSRSAGARPRWRYLLLWLLVATLFTLVHVRQSLHGGRLALPPTFDDIGYLRDGQARLQLLFDQGPVAALADYRTTTPHSPWSTCLAAAAFLVFGMREWAPAAANGLLVFAVLLHLGHRGRRLPPAWALVASGALLSWPLLGQAIENFRPDIASGLVTAALALYIVRRRWLGAGRWRHYLAGGGFALALLIKPTISPVTSLIVLSAMTAATITDLLALATDGDQPRRRRLVFASWARCLGTAVVLAAPHFLLAARHLSAYVYRNTFGELKDVWDPRLSGSQQALYYLSGEGGRLMLAAWLYLWLALAAAALAAVIARRDRQALARLPATAVVLAVSYAAVTLPAHKNPFLGTVLPGLLMFTAIEMMVYLAARPAAARGKTGAGKTTIAGRCLLVALLVAGVATFRWPYQLTAGGPLAAHENRRHRRLLETVYQDLRHADGDQTRVFFTQISAFLNPPLLEYRAGLDRLTGFSSRDLQLSKRPLYLDHELMLADHVIALSPGNRHAMAWLPGAETQRSTLERLAKDAEFVLTGIYGTVGQGEVYLFTRATGFRGVRALAGIGPLEGPYPQWDLHVPVRWAMGPVSRFEVRLPRATRVRMRWHARGEMPGQTMKLRVAGSEIFNHRFDQLGVFEQGEVFHDLLAGSHLLELEHSHWHSPSELDNRPRAALLRDFTVLPFYDAASILGPAQETDGLE